MEKIKLSIATTDKLGKPEYQYQYFYRASEVDARIAELEAENKRLHKENEQLRNMPKIKTYAVLVPD